MLNNTHADFLQWHVAQQISLELSYNYDARVPFPYRNKLRRHMIQYNSSLFGAIYAADSGGVYDGSFWCNGSLGCQCRCHCCSAGWERSQ